jgi:hypothetical protein
MIRRLRVRSETAVHSWFHLLLICGPSQDCNEKMLLTNGAWTAKAWRVRFGLLGCADLFIGRLRKVESTDEKNPVPKDAVRLLFTWRKALGWPDKPIGRSDILGLATYNQGRAAIAWLARKCLTHL